MFYYKIAKLYYIFKAIPRQLVGKPSHIPIAKQFLILEPKTVYPSSHPISHLASTSDTPLHLIHPFSGAFNSGHFFSVVYYCLRSLKLLLKCILLQTGVFPDQVPLARHRRMLEPTNCLPVSHVTPHAALNTFGH